MPPAPRGGGLVERIKASFAGIVIGASGAVVGFTVGILGMEKFRVEVLDDRIEELSSQVSQRSEAEARLTADVTRLTRENSQLRAAVAPVAVVTPPPALPDSAPPPPRRRLATRVLVERARPADPFDGELVFRHLGMRSDSTVTGGRRASFSVTSADGREKTFTDLPMLSDVEFEGYRLSVIVVAADWLTLRVATIGPEPR
jgi:hypothetical protein